jgi:hypothetical protein
MKVQAAGLSGLFHTFYIQAAHQLDAASGQLLDGHPQVISTSTV